MSRYQIFLLGVLTGLVLWFMVGVAIWILFSLGGKF